MVKKYKEIKTKNKILIIFIIIALMAIGIVSSINFYKNKEINKQEELNEEVLSNEEIADQNIEPEKEEVKKEEQSKEIKQIEGYKVIGKIKISKINLEDVILEKTTDSSLNLGLTKFWGPEMNEIGNFSITGHNYKIDRSPLFSQLNKLVEGDTFILQDLKNRTITYKIYKKYTVDPNDTTPIDQNKDGKREATLITCTKGAINRIILKAREI